MPFYMRLEEICFSIDDPSATGIIKDLCNIGGLSFGEIDRTYALYLSIGITSFEILDIERNIFKGGD